MERIAVLLDGYVVCAAAAILHAIDPAEPRPLPRRPSFRRKARIAEVLRRLGKKPLLDLGMRLGEGSGAAMAIGVVKAAVACHQDMATFASAGVDNKEA